MINLKKIIIILFSLTLIYLVTNNNQDEIIIPSNSIRFRVIANSNSLEDEKEKLAIKNDIEKRVYNLINDAKTEEEARKKITNNLSNIEGIVKEYNTPYKINYGSNYFPTKNYKGVLYESGNYESLVITLGEGLGHNFWCVLFPPLCLLDNDKEDVSDVEYQFYVKKMLNKF